MKKVIGGETKYTFYELNDDGSISDRVSLEIHREKPHQFKQDVLDLCEKLTVHIREIQKECGCLSISEEFIFNYLFGASSVQNEKPKQDKTGH
jgi:hypothetical protein